MIAVMKVFICLFCFISCGWGFMGFTSLYNTHAEPPVDSDDYKTTVRLTAKDKWVEQKVDHFNPKDTRVWKMRYLENDRYFQAGEFEVEIGINSASAKFLQVGRFLFMSEANGKSLRVGFPSV